MAQLLGCGIGNERGEAPALEFQVFVCVAEHMQDRAVARDKHPGRREPIEDRVIGLGEPAPRRRAFGWAGRAAGRQRKRQVRVQRRLVAQRGGRQQSQRFAQAHIAQLAENAPVLVDRAELVAQLAHGLARPEKQNSIPIEREMEQHQRHALRHLVEIDQQVAAADQVHPGEGRILEQVVRAEDHEAPQLRLDLILAAIEVEIALQQFRIERFGDRLAIDAAAGPLEGGTVDVGRKHLGVEFDAFLARIFLQRDRDRIGFLARRAAGHPNSHLALRRHVRHDLGKRFFRKHAEGLGIAEIRRDPDQQILAQEVDFVRLPRQLRRVGRKIVDMRHLRAAADPTPDRRFLVVAEIGAAPPLQQLQNLTLGIDQAAVVDRLVGKGQRVAVENALDETRQLLRRRGRTREIPLDERSRHAVEPRRRRVLREHHAACVADRRGPQGSVGAGAGEDDGDRLVGLVARKRLQEGVDREVQMSLLVLLFQEQKTLLDDQRLLRRPQVDHIRLNRESALCSADTHARAAGEQFVHHGREIRRQMLDDDEGGPAFGPHRLEEQLQRLEPAGRGADRHDGDRGSQSRRDFDFRRGVRLQRRRVAAGPLGRVDFLGLAIASAFGLAGHLLSSREFAKHMGETDRSEPPNATHTNDSSPPATDATGGPITGFRGRRYVAAALVSSPWTRPSRRCVAA